MLQVNSSRNSSRTTQPVVDQRFLNGEKMDKLANGLLWYFAFLFSTTLHEAAHAFAGFRLGDRTAYEGGQVTLNPIPHMKREPVGTILVPAISYLASGWMIGWASTPYNFLWALDNPKSSAKMSLAGPSANLLLLLTSALLLRIGLMTGTFIPPESVNFTRTVIADQEGIFTPIAALLNIFFSLNLLLFLFNLLPVPPLDGSGILPLFFSHNLAVKYLETIHHPRFALIGLLVAWKIFDFVYHPIHIFCINILYTGIARYG
jgi:Zn-dependent protease